MKKSYLCMCLILLFLVVGCSHSLRIDERNIQPAAVKPKPVSIGFLDTNDKLVNSTIDEISRSAYVTSVKKGYAIGSDIKVDYLCGLSQNMRFSAYGQNFVITFPGFLIFTHAWLGYKYHIDIDTQSKLLDTNGNTLSEITVVAPYDIRYTSFARGAAASLVGWLTPAYGLLDIIPGAIFSGSYDHRATPEFIERARPSYSTFVSSKVLEQIASLQSAPSSSFEKYFRNTTVVLDDVDKEEVSNAVNVEKFVVYLMREKSGQLVPVKNTTVQLPEDTQQILNKIANKEILPDAGILQNIIHSLKIPDIEIPKDMKEVSIYTMQGDKMVVLYEGSGTQIVRK